MAGKTIEPSDVNYYDELPAKRPVAQARKSLNFRFIFTEIDKPFFVLIMLLLMFGMVMLKNLLEITYVLLKKQLDVVMILWFIYQTTALNHLMLSK